MEPRPSSDIAGAGVVGIIRHALPKEFKKVQEEPGGDTAYLVGRGSRKAQEFAKGRQRKTSGNQ
jgi:hypothetical protein